MAPLSAVVSAALAAEGVAAEGGALRLLHGGKPLDLQAPLRFANLPAGAKLQLLTGETPGAADVANLDHYYIHHNPTCNVCFNKSQPHINITLDSHFIGFQLH